MDVVLQLAANVLIPGALFALIAAGFSLIYAVSRVLHVAHGAVVILGGYLFWFGWSMLGLHPVVAAAAAMALTALAGIALNALVYERLRDRAAVAAAGTLIATLSVLLIAQHALLLLFGAQTRSLAALQGAVHAFGPVLATSHELRIVGCSALTVAALALWLAKSRLGTALRAVADQETAAEVVGISARRMRSLAFGIGSALGGLGGVLFAVEYGLEPGMSTGVALRMFFRAVIGGIGSIGGAVAGSLLTETGVALTGWFWNTAWIDLVSFLLTFAVLALRPHGLFGRGRRSI